MDQRVQLSAENLYRQAFEFHKKNDQKNLMETCAILLSYFPNSNEANWAIKRFKLTEQDISLLKESLPKLINCPDCNREVSRNAVSCLNCGCLLNPAHEERNASSPFAIACIVISVISMFTPVILVNIVIIGAVICGVFSLVRREKLKPLAIVGIVISLMVFWSANKQMDDARSKLNEMQHELEKW